jgi:hypothetical protein
VSATTDDAQGGDAPRLRIVRGEPSPEQLAALVVVLAARGGAEPPPDRRSRRWADRARAIGAPLRPGRGAWSAAVPR